MTDFVPATKKYSREWEQVCPFSKRLETSNGWVLVYCENQRDTSSVFVPDPDKTWVLKKQR